MIVTIYSNEDSIDWGATGEDRIVQNVRNILRTRQYEVPFMRNMGINPDFMGASSHDMKTELATHVTEVINTYEPRVKVTDVRIESCTEDGEYVIAVELEV